MGGPISLLGFLHNFLALGSIPIRAIISDLQEASHVQGQLEEEKFMKNPGKKKKTKKVAK